MLYRDDAERMAGKIGRDLRPLRSVYSEKPRAADGVPGKEAQEMSAEQNKAIARRVYQIVSTGDFERAEEIVDQDAPDNELLPDDPPAKLIDTFKETFTEAREGFPDLSITIEDVMAEGDRVGCPSRHARHPLGRVPRHCSHRQAGGGQGHLLFPHLRRQDLRAFPTRRRSERPPAPVPMFLNFREHYFHAFASCLVSSI